MMLIKTLLQELGQVITNPPPATDGEEVKEVTCNINQQNIAKYAK